MRASAAAGDAARRARVGARTSRAHVCARLRDRPTAATTTTTRMQQSTCCNNSSEIATGSIGSYSTDTAAATTALHRQQTQVHSCSTAATAAPAHLHAWLDPTASDQQYDCDSSHTSATALFRQQLESTHSRMLRHTHAHTHTRVLAHPLHSAAQLSIASCPLLTPATHDPVANACHRAVTDLRASALRKSVSVVSTARATARRSVRS